MGLPPRLDQRKISWNNFNPCSCPGKPVPRLRQANCSELFQSKLFFLPRNMFICIFNTSLSAIVGCRIIPEGVGNNGHKLIFETGENFSLSASIESLLCLKNYWRIIPKFAKLILLKAEGTSVHCSTETGICHIMSRRWEMKYQSGSHSASVSLCFLRHRLHNFNWLSFQVRSLHVQCVMVCLQKSFCLFWSNVFLRVLVAVRRHAEYAFNGTF